MPVAQWLEPDDASRLFGKSGVLHVLTTGDVPPGHRTVRSPSDPDAYSGHKRDLTWSGDTSDKDQPHLTTHVVTTDAAQTDMEQTQVIHQTRSARGLTPGKHVLDAGNVDAKTIAHSREQRDWASQSIQPMAREEERL